MSNVPQHLIEEARNRGIVEGAQILSPTFKTVAIVKSPDEWSYHWSTNTVSTGGAHVCNGRAWATVITPAPQKEEEGLKEGDSVECGPAMRAAIIELAKELGICNGRDGGLTNGASSGVWSMYGTGLVNVCSNFHALNTITPEAFIAKMRVTAKQPRPIKIDGHEVKYESGHIKVGCRTIPNATVRAIAEKLID